MSAAVQRLLDSGAGGGAGKRAAAAPPPLGAPGAPVQGPMWRAAAAAPGPALPLLPADAAALLSRLVPSTAPPVPCLLHFHNGGPCGQRRPLKNGASTGLSTIALAQLRSS